MKIATAWRHWNRKEFIQMAVAIVVAKDAYLYKQNNYSTDYYNNDLLLNAVFTKWHKLMIISI